MGYTLADYARLAADPLRRAVIDILRTESVIMDYLNFEDWHTLSMETIRTKKLPAVGTRKINDTFDESKGETDSIFDKLTDVGGYLDVDKLLVKAQSITDQRALQTQLYTRAIALEFNRLFFHGNPPTKEEEFAGLYWRLNNLLPSTQMVDAGGLDISPDASGLAANQLRFIDWIHELIHECDMHKCDFLFCNDTVKLRLGSALRASGMLRTTEDSYGRKFETFGEGGPKIVDVGPSDPLDKTARILPNTENATGTSLTTGTFSSVVAVKVGQGEYVEGFQLYPLDVNDIGMLESGVAYRTVIDWPVGIYMIHPWSVARLYDIQAA